MYNRKSIKKLKGLSAVQFSESVRRYILIGMVLLIFAGIITSKVLAKKQDEEYSFNDQLYQQVLQLYSDGSYEEAKVYSSELLERVPNSEIANYLGGLIAAGNNDVFQAAILLQKTLDINPHKVEDPIFMLQFGEVLVSAERKEDARVVLEKCRDMGWIPENYPEYQQRVNELLTQITAGGY